MDDKVIDILKDLVTGGKYARVKLEYKDVSETLSSLKNLNVLQISNNSYIVKDVKLLSKVIELKSIPKLNEWIGSEKSDTITNDFSNSTIGQVIQDSDLKNSPIKNKVKATPKSKPDKKSSLKKFLFNPWVIGFSIVAIEEITLGKIWRFIINLF